MGMDATFKAATAADAPTLFYCVELLLPSAVTIRLLLGGGFITFSGKTFLGLNDTYGTLSKIEAVEDGTGNQAPELSIEIMPPSNAAAATLAAAAAQGSDVTLWWGAVNTTTGAVIGTPEQIGIFDLDVPILNVAENARSVEIRAVSVFDRLFETDEGLGLTDASHQSIWPGETGFEMVTEVTRQLPWGADAPRPGVVINQGTLVQAIGSIFGGGRFIPDAMNPY